MRVLPAARAPTPAQNWLSKSRRRGSAVEELDDVEDLLMGMVEGCASAKLQKATRVGGDDGLRACGLGVAHFFRKQFH